ncbi:MAG: hypothetical protein HY329_22310 [Chloroflexi bacterium]|nr:hypothetical protein [Chloroflexota bacterium]
MHDETQIIDRIESFLQHEGVANARRIGLRFDHMPTRDELREMAADLVMIRVDVGGRSYYLPNQPTVVTSRS